VIVALLRRTTLSLWRQEALLRSNGMLSKISPYGKHFQNIIPCIAVSLPTRHWLFNYIDGQAVDT